MTYQQKDFLIMAQNANATAAEITQFLMNNPQVNLEDVITVFNNVRTAIVEGVIAETAERVVATGFEAPAAAPAAAPIPAAPAYNSAPKRYNSGGGAPRQDKSALIARLIQNPRGFYDNRVGKTNPKSPDFKDKQTGEAIWLSDVPAGTALPTPDQF